MHLAPPCMHGPTMRPRTCQDVDPDALGAALDCALDAADQLVEAAVHAAVTQQADEVHGVLREGLADQLPARQLKHLAIGQRHVHQAGTLVDHLGEVWAPGAGQEARTTSMPPCRPARCARAYSLATACTATVVC